MVTAQVGGKLPLTVTQCKPLVVLGFQIRIGLRHYVIENDQAQFGLVMTAVFSLRLVYLASFVGNYSNNIFESINVINNDKGMAG